MRRARALLARTIRATRTLVGDTRIPKSLRWVGGFALLPIPGPFDEAVLLLLAPIFAVFYSGPLREAWREAARSPA
jgi:hypothetical protein